MSEIEELIYKVTVELNEDDLQKAKKKVQDLKETVKQAGIKIDVPTTDWTQVQAGTQWPDEFKKQKSEKDKQKIIKKDESKLTDELKTEAKEKAQENSSVVSVLKKSEEHLLAILDVLKKVYRVQLKTSNSSSGNNTDDDDGAGGIYNKIKKGSKGNMLGTIFAVGEVLFTAVKKIANSVIEAAEKIKNQIVEKYDRELDLYKLAEQTGMAVKSLYRLQTSAELTGSSLQEIIGTAKKMQKDMLFGLDDKKAMMMMAMGINPFDSMSKMMENPIQATKEIYEQAKSTTSHMPKMLQTGFLEDLGFSSDYQYSANHMGDKEVREGVESVSLKRGDFMSPSEWRSQYVMINATLKGVQASLDKALDQNKDLANKFIINYAEMQAKIINLTGETINKANKTLEEFFTDDTPKVPDKTEYDLTTTEGKLQYAADQARYDSKERLKNGESHYLGVDILSNLYKKMTDREKNSGDVQNNTSGNAPPNPSKNGSNIKETDSYEEIDKKLRSGAKGQDTSLLDRKRINAGETPPSPAPPYSNDFNRSQSKRGNS